MPVTEIPRRARLDLFTPAERAIREAIIAVESTGCDERLTWAVMALSDAQAWVADFVDGVPVAEHYPRPIGCTGLECLRGGGDDAKGTK